jgi:hypothetical protein
MDASLRRPGDARRSPRKQMKLTARHNDGFTTHLLHWTLTASNGSATVTANWFTGSERECRTLTIPFSDDTIKSVATAIVGLRPTYEGTTDDFPDYELRVDSEQRTLCTRVYDSIGWDDDVKPEIDRFMSVWKSIFRDVERALAIPGRHCK